MKIIHCADLHLGSVMTSNFTGEMSRQRKAEILNTFNEMINYAGDNDVQGIIIAGDLFDTKNVPKSVGNVVVRAILNHPEIEFYYLKGNHDENSFLDNLEMMPENLMLFGNEWKSYKLCESENVVVTGIENNTDINIYDTLVLDSGKINIVMLHGQECEHMGTGKDEIVIKNLRNKGIDYLALGHIHTFKVEKLDGRGKYCYPGCMEGRGFDECGEHGFVELNIDEDNRNIETKFVPIAYRNLYEIHIDVSDCESTAEIKERIEEEFRKKNYDSRHLMKVVLEGNLDIDAEKNIDLLLKQLADRFFFLKIKDETKIRVNYKDYELDESLKGEFIRTVNSREDLTEEDKSVIIKYGLQALAGEEIE